MTSEGYIYLLLRADFIEQHRQVYKIGVTRRFPPHKRLWDYPYGSLFMSLIRTQHPLVFEKQLKVRLGQSSQVTCLKDIGLEYFEGSLPTIIQCIMDLYAVHNDSPPLSLISPTVPYLLQLNRIHYIVNYDSVYFDSLLSYQVPYDHQTSLEVIPSEDIYQSYHQMRQWHPPGYPDNYVIRHGLVSIPPTHQVRSNPFVSLTPNDCV